MARGLSEERIEKILLHNICNEIFQQILISQSWYSALVVSALAFLAGDRGSIPRLGKSSN